jgi:hypothetical protein
LASKALITIEKVWKPLRRLDPNTDGKMLWEVVEKLVERVQDAETRLVQIRRVTERFTK